MLSTTSLLDQPLIFTQRRLLTGKEFMDAYKQRVLSGARPDSWEVLEALHKLGVLVPFYRVAKNLRFFINAAKKQGYPPLMMLTSHLNSPGLINDYTNHKRTGLQIVDPAAEPYRPWRRFIRRIENETFWTSSFLYSPYQVLLIPYLRPLMETVRWRRQPGRSGTDGTAAVAMNPQLAAQILRKAARQREVAIVLSALDNQYFPSLRGHFNHAIYSGFTDLVAAIQEQQRIFDPVALLRWIGWDYDRVKSTAWQLLNLADQIDPLKDWYELVRLTHPDKLDRLRGDALIALDYRRAAEKLLRFYEDLVRQAAAPPLEPSPRYVFGEFDRRLKGDPNDLDAVLMEFGLSPHPALILVLEGDTEWVLMPKVMDVLGIPQQSIFIRLFKGQGINTQFDLLARFAAVPTLGEEFQGAVEFTQPPTHFMVVTDAEQTVKTAEQRQTLRQRWINEIWKAISKAAYQTPTLKQQLEYLIHFETWGDAPFEYAHFTDMELAEAMVAIYPGTVPVTSEKLVGIIAKLRTQGTNIEKAWESWAPPRPRKPQLALYLWETILEPKLRAAASIDELHAIPIARIALHAADLAGSIPRDNVIIKYQDEKKSG